MFYLVGCNSIPSFSPAEDSLPKEEIKSQEVTKVPYHPPIIDYLKKEPKIYEIQTTPFVVSFVGDVMMDWSIKGALEKHGPDFPWKDVTPILSASDVSIANLETAVTTRGVADDKQYAFRSAPESLNGLANAGIDIVSLANNHSLDYGVEGLLDTFDHISAAGMRYFGAGKSEEEAYQSIEMTLGGRKVSFLAFSRVLPSIDWYAVGDSPGIASGYQEDRVIEIIRKEKAKNDLVFVYIHWGKEKISHPEPYIRNYGKLMVDAGADAVVGSHPHVLQGVEYYKEKPIAYSLGNFLFPDYVSGLSADTGIMNFVVDDKITLEFYPYVILDNQIVSPSDTYIENQRKYVEGISYSVKAEKLGDSGFTLLPKQ